MIIDGHAVALDPSGKGELAIDVSRDLEGPADAILPFERKLPYTITQPGSRRGLATSRCGSGSSRLRVEAPGESIIVEGETFMLSGHTLKDGRITVSGRPITVDAEGRFAQLMNVSSIGETTVVVRAEAKDHAPRLVRVRVKRVTSLRDEAASFRQSATTDYSSIAVAGREEGPRRRARRRSGRFSTRRRGDLAAPRREKWVRHEPVLARVEFGGRTDACDTEPRSARTGTSWGSSMVLGPE